MDDQSLGATDADNAAEDGVGGRRATGGSAAGGLGTGGGGGGSGGGLPATGGSLVGAGGSEPLEAGEFYFLGQRDVPTEMFPDAPMLQRYTDAGSPEHIFGSGSIDELLIDVALPVADAREFFPGMERWAEGPWIEILSWDPLSDETNSYGNWGLSPFGVLNSTLDAIVRLDRERVLALKFVNNEASAEVGLSQIWLLGQSDQGRVPDDAHQLLFEKEMTRLRSGGILEEEGALFWDESDVFLIAEDTVASTLFHPAGKILNVSLSPSQEAVFILVDEGEAYSIHLWRDSEQLAVDPGGVLVESVSWHNDEEIVFQADGVLKSWSGNLVDTSDSPGEFFAPRGGTVAGDFGFALQTETLDGRAVAFVKDGEIKLCGAFDEPMRLLVPHEKEGTPGVLFDFADPEVAFDVGPIYFCASGGIPLNVLHEHGYVGRLIAPP